MRFTTIALAICVLASPAFADDDKRVGLGLGVGVATGPNLQLMTSYSSHVDIGVGLALDDRLRVQADHAWRLANFSSNRSISVPLYLGVGGFVTDRNNGVSDAGVRMPLGVQADFARAPLQVFGEFATELAFVRFTDNQMVGPDRVALTGLMGVRAAF
jgi:hypothetical protein